MTGSPKATIGFVGLGHMGGTMAARLLSAGYDVGGEALHRETARALEEQGLHWHGTACELAEAVEIVLTSLPDDDAVEAAAGGPDGLLAGLGAGKVWVDMSTVSPRVSRGLAARVHATGATMLDAPVSGSVPQAQSGTLTIMVGGDEDSYRRVEPILRELGTPTRIGGNGQGLALKLAINISLAVQMLAFSEGLLLAVRDGVDPELASEVMAGSPIGSPMIRARVPLVLDLPEEAWFDVRLMHKDIGLALALARELGLRLLSAEAADAELTMAEELGYGARDIASAYAVLAKTAM
jgi:3-hydroxyisobutyrate dehydrogenase